MEGTAAGAVSVGSVGWAVSSGEMPELVEATTKPKMANRL